MYACRRIAFLSTFFLSCSLPLPAFADAVDLSTPTCSKPFDFANGKCAISDEKLAKLKGPGDCTNVDGLKADGAKCTRADPAPTPQCRSVAGGSVQFKDGKCWFDSHVTSSASGDYVGDYFTIIGVPNDDPGRFGGPPGTHLKVLSQKSLGETDRMLTLIKADVKMMFWTKENATGETVTVKASELIEYGAERTGWTYGALAIPYKYYFGGKNFGSSVAIGPYVGRRWGRPGSAVTLAVSAAIGSVKGEVRDAQDKITSTPDLMAYSAAVGVMWDISKAQGVKPFKIGMFVGADTVSADDGVKFKNNRKPWVAFQVGFDFTDN